MRLHRPRQHPSSSDMPRPSHPASRFVTIAHTPLLPRRDGARNAADLQARSTATDWHDGQITCSRQNAVNEIFAVIARSESNEAIQSVPQEDSGLLRFARNDGSRRRMGKAKRAHHQHPSTFTLSWWARRDAPLLTLRHSPTSFSHSSSVKTSTPCFFASASFEPAPGPATT
jgi:hypothetical protein